MGVYSQPKRNSVLESYLDNNFLESCLNETASKLHEKVMCFKEGTTEWSIVEETVKEIMSAPISESTKLTLIGELSESMKESSIDESQDGYVSESVVLEFQGNPKKNEEFIQCLKDLEELCRFNMDKIKNLCEGMEKLLTISDQTIKSPNTYKAKLEAARAAVKAYNDWYDKAGKKISGQVTWRQFDQKIRKFNNKYSEITMEEKKKLDAKLAELQNSMDPLVSPWAKGGKKIIHLIDNVNKLDEIDHDYTKTFSEIAGSFENVMIQEANYTFKDIVYVRRSLGIEKENSIIYKAINKILK